MSDAGQLSLDQALAVVSDHADYQWVKRARRAVAHVAECKPTFTADDVWDALDAEYDVATHERRALGAVMRWATRRGICHPTDDYTPSRRPECHKRPVRVWARGESGEIRWAA
jgi:hypothetical protein